MSRLSPGLVIFALVIKVGSEAFSDLFASTGCKSIPGPTAILREIENLIPCEERCPTLRSANPVVDTRTISIEPGWCENGITVVRRLRVEEDHKIDVIWKSQTQCSWQGRGACDIRLV